MFSWVMIVSVAVGLVVFFLIMAVFVVVNYIEYLREVKVLKSIRNN